jgi:DNA-binding NarL/FixJ family response regulator
MPGEGIVAAVGNAAHGGDALLAPAVIRRLVERFSDRRPAGAGNAATLRQLTDRGAEVLRHVARGMSNAESAADL